MTTEGIEFQGRYYSCERALKEHWFTRARKGRFKIAVSYDKRAVDRIYVHDRTALGFEVAQLTPRSIEFAGLSGWEAHDLGREYARMSARRRDAEILERASTNADIARTGRRARKEAGTSLAEGSLSSQVRDMRKARAAEVAADRPAQVSYSRPDAPERLETSVMANVVPIRPGLPANDVSAPTMAEMLANLRAKKDPGNDGR